jgi:IclR family acetate operon transcriptional repressor
MAKPKPPAKTIDFLSTVERAMQVVEFLSDAPDGLSVSELGRRLDINKSIVFRILNTFEALGYIFQDKYTQHYRLTYRISNLALRQMAHSGLLDQCAPVLRELAERSGELVRLAIIENERPVWVHAESGRQRQLRIDPVYGHETILHVHAASKAFLMTLPDEDLDRLLGDKPFKAYSKHTITTPRALKTYLKEARREGFALNYDELEVGTGTVAAPILVTDLGGSERCVGVVSLAAPTSRMDRAAFIRSADLVIKTCERLSKVWPMHQAFDLVPRLARRG